MVVHIRQTIGRGKQSTVFQQIIPPSKTCGYTCYAETSAASSAHRRPATDSPNIFEFGGALGASQHGRYAEPGRCSAGQAAALVAILHLRFRLSPKQGVFEAGSSPARRVVRSRIQPEVAAVRECSRPHQAEFFGLFPVAPIGHQSDFGDADVARRAQLFRADSSNARAAAYAG